MYLITEKTKDAVVYQLKQHLNVLKKELKDLPKKSEYDGKAGRLGSEIMDVDALLAGLAGLKPLSAF